MRFRQLDGEFSVFGFADNLHVLLVLEDGFQSMPQKCMVVNDEYA